MERWTVRSSMIRAIGYDRRRRTLQVEFRNGNAYHYLDIPYEVYAAFIGAASHGSFFNQVIKSKYPGKRVA